MWLRPLRGIAPTHVPERCHGRMGPRPRRGMAPMGWQDIAGHGRGCGIKPFMGELAPDAGSSRKSPPTLRLQHPGASQRCGSSCARPLGPPGHHDRPGTIRDFCRQVRQHGEGSGRIEVVRHGVHERLRLELGSNGLASAAAQNTRQPPGGSLRAAPPGPTPLGHTPRSVGSGARRGTGVWRPESIASRDPDHDEVAQRFANLSPASCTIAVWNHQRAKGSWCVRHSDWAISLS